MADSESKKRKRPTFQHLPPTQAAKAKQAWVKKVKLRSNWAKERKKLGSPRDVEDDTMQERSEEASEEDEFAEGVEVTGQIEERARDEASKEEEFRPLKRRRQSPPTSPRKRHTKEMRESKDRPSQDLKERKDQAFQDRRHRPSQEMQERKERVRDLTRTAYAKESLHTFKADPLGRQRGAGQARGNGRRRGTGTGRGQPNMKLRMNALLEKIKMDVGV